MPSGIRSSSEEFSDRRHRESQGLRISTHPAVVAANLMLSPEPRVSSAGREVLKKLPHG